MNRFSAPTLCAAIARLQTLSCGFGMTRGSAAMAGGILAPEEHLNAFKDAIQESESLCVSAKFNDAIRVIKLARNLIEVRSPNISILEAECNHILNALFAEVAKRKFLFIAEDRYSYLDQQALFGPKVESEFPSASYDIREAGNCLATECTTAAVFHLMRVAEVGLRVLAWDRRVKFKKGVPLQLQDWESILKSLEDAERAIQGYRKTLARESQFAFYHGAMVELRAFKNLYRHRLTHARENYDRNQALSAMDHVSAFMKILAEKISERKRTPRVWKTKD